MEDPVSRTVKAAKRTHFLDVKEAKNGEKCLAITESRFAGEGNERERSRIVVFGDSMDAFVDALHDLVKLV